MYYPSLRARTSFAIAMTGAVVMAALTWNRIHLLRGILCDRVITRTQTTHSLMSQSIAENNMRGDTKATRELLEVAVRQPMLEAVVLLDDRRNVIEVGVTGTEGFELDLPEPDTTDLLSETREFYVMTAPLAPSAPALGSLQIIWRLDRFRHDLRVALLWSIALNLVGWSVLMLVAWILAGRLLRPLDEVEASAKRIANGLFSERVNYRRPDELGRLAVAFNEMAASLDSLTRGLKEKVDLATADLQATNRQLREANVRLSELDRTKSEFVSIVSHELRTPLTSIIGFAQTLKTLELPEEKKMHYLDIIETEGLRLAALIRDFLDVSRMQMGRLELRVASVDVPGLIGEIMEGLQSSRVPIRSEIGPSCGSVPADRGRLKQVILNLLDNALRYARQEINLKVDEYGGFVRFCVADDGRGIPESEHERVFEQFRQLEDRDALSKGSSGLGLAICKGIVEQHGGRIRVESGAGAGARFVFEIPKTLDERSQHGHAEDTDC